MNVRNGMTIGQLARRSRLSRSALLYYDRLGVVRPTARSSGNYRLYGAADVARLEQVCLYRSMGIPLKDIIPLLDRAGRDDGTQTILQRRLATLETQIDSLKDQQRQIVRLLEQFGSQSSVVRNSGKARRARGRSMGIARVGPKKEKDVISKKRWVEIMTAAGFSEQDKQNWHRQFEKMEPEAHQEFLESLGIDAEEIARIREWSRK